ncbi:MAG: penicillin-binding protein 2 [Gemmatimonadetes bacterium]|nr:penicillin-binding protein 2 [Gemmatimonadota bacterium]
MRTYDAEARRLRARGALVATVVLLGVLVLGFFRVQVLRSSSYRLRSDSNRLRALPIPAPRGALFDRHGRLIAENVPGYAISLLPAPVDSLRATLQALAPPLALTAARIDVILAGARRYPHQPVLVEGDASFEQVSAVEERRVEFPGVLIEMGPKRRYVAGPTTAHVTGYVSEVSDQELARPEFEGYSPGQIVGKEGIERQYESLLQGRPGVRYVEVDALGRIVGAFQGRPELSAVPGQPLRLSLDLELQQWIDRIFPDTMRGAVVALNAEDGGVLALYSRPSFDPNDFVGGIDADLWTGLNADPARPLLNRALNGVYPPGSTFKIATAGIALARGVVAPDEYMSIPCRGGMQFGNRYFRCWRPGGHGYLTLADAIRDSCDVYFYQLGLRIGLEPLVEAGNRLGFRGRCGIDLPGESAGLYPEDLGYWKRRFGYDGTPAEALSMAIGQGPNAQTPLKMAQFFLAVARDGTAPPPRVVVTDSVEPGFTLDISPENLEWLREGMRRVLRPGGTAYLSSLEHWDLMGKTGTSQNSQDPERDHAWFVGLAGPRGGDPEIVVAVIVEFGLSGSGVAAPIVAKTADFYLRRKHGIPVDTMQTLGEHLRAGRPARWAVWR